YPGSDLSVTCAGKFDELLEHIEVHRYYMGLELQREVEYEEAAGHWYETVYRPVADIINELGLLDTFPGRTEADLYLWLSKYRAEKEEELGWEIKDTDAAASLAEEYGENSSSIFGRIGRNVLDIVLPDPAEEPPDSSPLRRDHRSARESESLFSEILVPLSGEHESWAALEQGIEVARREGGRINGLFIQKETDESQRTSEIEDKLKWRCTEEGIGFTFTVAEGPVAKTICSRARWVDLVIFNLAFPPKADAAGKITSGVRKLINRCNRPLLSVPAGAAPIRRALLAFNGSQKAKSALYVATYIAGKWQIPLITAHIQEDDSDSSEVLSPAKKYLSESGIEADYVSFRGKAEYSLLQ
ncbi:MAG: universal stress protein, partial [bacterium]